MLDFSALNKVNISFLLHCILFPCAFDSDLRFICVWMRHNLASLIPIFSFVEYSPSPTFLQLIYVAKAKLTWIDKP